MKSKTRLEIRSMSPLELEAKLRETREKLFRLKFRHSSTPVKNGLEIRQLRRLVAMLITIMKERSVEQNVQAQAK